jgi:hypothetical protein
LCVEIDFVFAYHSTVADEEHQHIIIEHIMDVKNVFLSTVADAEQQHVINEQILNVQKNKGLCINTEKNYKS